MSSYASDDSHSVSSDSNFWSGEDELDSDYDSELVYRIASPVPHIHRGESNMHVIKRNGEEEPIDLNKVTKRLIWLCTHPYSLRINPIYVAKKVIGEVHAGIHTKELDEHAAHIASDMVDIHPDYGTLATRIAVNNHHKNCSAWGSFSSTMELCYRNRARENGREVDTPRITRELFKFVQIHKAALDQMVDYDRDYRFSYFGFKTLMGSYLLKRSGSTETEKTRPQDLVLERPQDMWMRVACAIHMNRLYLRDTASLEYIRETYDVLSHGLMTHATPTLTNAGTPGEQYLSCFLLGMDDSLDSIMKVASDAAKISKYSGGVGFWGDLRAEGSVVRGVNGISRGGIPFLEIFQACAKAVDQGGRRPGSFASYQKVHHPDFMRWVGLRRPTTGDLQKLFYGCWVPSLFMRYVEEDRMWYFFNPVDCPKLYNSYGDEFERHYEEAVRQGMYQGEPIRAQLVLQEICKTQIQTGMPYMCYSDHINLKSNQQNIGIIHSSNLCAEINEVSTAEEYACCTLGTLCLGEYVRESSNCDCLPNHHGTQCKVKMWFDFDELIRVTRIMTRNLNKIIDINLYPVPETRRSNLRHRPLGIGIMGLADAFVKMGYRFTGPDARRLNSDIMETMQWAALSESCELAKQHGPYESFPGSPFSRGVMQHHMWGLTNESLRCDWDTLVSNIKEWGTRNSLLIAHPPTASTSQIQNQTECFEPFMSNFYARRTKAGTFTIINLPLVNIMIQHGYWTHEIREAFVSLRGSIQYVERDPRTHVFAKIPEWIREVGLTGWEQSMRDLIAMDAEAGPWICQARSSNRFMKMPTVAKLCTMHMLCHKLGIKTGMYYLRMLSSSENIAFGAKVEKRQTKAEVVEDQGPSCGLGGCSG